jgi:hypothetical protein
MGTVHPPDPRNTGSRSNYSQLPYYSEEHDRSDQKGSHCDVHGLDTWPEKNYESWDDKPASNRYRLSLVHSQLKIGSANQRHLFSPAATLLSRQFR